MLKKYEILEDQFIIFDGVTLYRIQALVDFADIKKGDIGGWIENESNLSQTGSCWVYDNGKVYNGAKIFDNVEVRKSAIVNNGNIICGENIITDHTIVGKPESSHLYGNAKFDLEEAKKIF
ncbi:hypothetical protein [Faecalibacillus faecis]|uniref:hypothetical protein n=1 Tax=Faecalibacillus faecis TaxID=1982628 RepID=UPI003862E0FB